MLVARVDTNGNLDSSFDSAGPVPGIAVIGTTRSVSRPSGLEFDGALNAPGSGHSDDSATDFSDSSTPRPVRHRAGFGEADPMDPLMPRPSGPRGAPSEAPPHR